MERQGDPDPRRGADAGAGVPREADGRGGGELRRADGALPGGRGDLSRRDRRALKDGVTAGHDLPRHLRDRDQEPRHRPAARRARARPPVAGAQGRGSPRVDGDGNEVEIEPDEEGEPVVYVFKTLADPFAGRINLFQVLLGDPQARLAAHQRARAHARSASASCSSRRARRWRTRTSSAPGDIGAVAKLKETHSGDVLSGKASIDLVPGDRASGRGDGVCDRGRRRRATRRSRDAPCDASRRRTRRSTSTATRRPASRSSPGCRRFTSR